MDAAAYAGHSRAVADAFVAAYPEHLRGRMRELGLDPERFAGPIAAGQAQLESAFGAWVDLGPTGQRSSPLELLRDALTHPTEAMIAAGVTPVERDALQERSLPGDLFDLVPATSQVLGDEAYRAHVAWGIARAEAVAGMIPAPPSTGRARRTAQAVAALVATDLMDRTRIAETADRVGYTLELWRNPAAVSDGLARIAPAVVFVDLRHAAADEAIRMLVAAHVRTVVYGPHVDEMAMAAARALGAAEVVPRSRFFARLPSMFPEVV